LPESNALGHRLVAAGHHAEGAGLVAAPILRKGDLAQPFILSLAALGPPAGEVEVGEVVQLLLVAAPMGEEQVVEPIIGVAGPGQEVVDLGGSAREVA